MKKQLIYLGPFAVLALNFYWSTLINPFAEGAYNFGFAFGLFLVIAVPSSIIAFIHRRLTKKKSEDPDFETLDSEEPKKKRTAYMYYFSMYCTLLGMALVLYLLMTKQ